MRFMNAFFLRLKITELAPATKNPRKEGLYAGHATGDVSDTGAR
jgi:hypothetical protein